MRRPQCAWWWRSRQDRRSPCCGAPGRAIGWSGVVRSLCPPSPMGCAAVTARADPTGGHRAGARGRPRWRSRCDLTARPDVCAAERREQPGGHRPPRCCAGRRARGPASHPARRRGRHRRRARSGHGGPGARAGHRSRPWHPGAARPAHPLIHARLSPGPGCGSSVAAPESPPTARSHLPAGRRRRAPPATRRYPPSSARC